MAPFARPGAAALLALGLLCVAVAGEPALSLNGTEKTTTPQTAPRKLISPLVSMGAQAAQLAQPTKLARDVSRTMRGLSKVIHKMYRQVRMDEKLFKSFKERMLQQEIDGADVELSWPAIKDLVHSEVETGRRQISDKVAEFKVDLLEMVQRGLDALRADVRATVTSRALQKTQKALLNSALAAARPPARLRAAACRSVLSSACKPSAHHCRCACAEEKAARAGKRAVKKRPPRNLTANLDAFLAQLPVSPAAKKDISQYVVKKVEVGKVVRACGALGHRRVVADTCHQAAKPAATIDLAGESAAQALQGVEKALAGQMSQKDLRGELFARLQDLTQSYLKNPTPVARQALLTLRKAVVRGLKTLR
jgi:hypothetical protein